MKICFRLLKVSRGSIEGLVGVGFGTLSVFGFRLFGFGVRGLVCVFVVGFSASLALVLS